MDVQKTFYFSVSHEDLINGCQVEGINQKGWQAEDYNLIFYPLGLCNKCFKEDKVVTQLGAFRFGLKGGYCLDCFPNNYKKSIEVKFLDSNVIHFIRFKADKIKKLYEETKECVLNEVLNDPAVQTDLQRKNQYQCGDCLGYKKGPFEFDAMNILREQGQLIYGCYNCSLLMEWTSGCSNINCPCGTLMCVYCLSGASDSHINHDLKECK